MVYVVSGREAEKSWWQDDGFFRCILRTRLACLALMEATVEYRRGKWIAGNGTCRLFQCLFICCSSFDRATVGLFLYFGRGCVGDA